MQHSRPWRRRPALALTFGAVVLGLAAFVLIAILPAALADSSVGTVTRLLFDVARWPALAAALLAALAVF